MLDCAYLKSNFLQPSRSVVLYPAAQSLGLFGCSVLSPGEPFLRRLLFFPVQAIALRSVVTYENNGSVARKENGETDMKMDFSFQPI